MKNEDGFDRIMCKVLFIFICLLIIIYYMNENIGNASERKWVSRYEYVTATSYCLCQKCTGKENHDGKTASGTNAFKIGVAVDPKFIPIGSRVDIPELTPWLLCDDIGGAIKNNKIDIRVPRVDGHKEALKYGVKRVKIRVWRLE